MSDLPDFFVLQAQVGGPFLRVVDQASGVMKFDETNARSPRAKFAMERSKTQDPFYVGYVSIRSCFNNKYWKINLPTGEPHTITASADEPLEVRESNESTGFRPFGSTDPDNFPGFKLIWIGRYMFAKIDVETGNLVVSGAGNTFPIIDWRKLLVLPSRVSFRLAQDTKDGKQDSKDGKYLCSRDIDGHNNHKFDSGTDAADPKVAHQLVPTGDGNYRIKDLTYGKFWRRNSEDDWIWADAEEEDHSNDTVFSFVKVSDQVFALRNLGNNKFVGGLKTKDVNYVGGDVSPGTPDCLNAHFPTITRETRLIVEDLVLKREIKDVIYRLKESKIYDEVVQEVSHSFAVNDSPDKETTITLTYSLVDSSSMNWSNSESLTLGAKVEFNTTVIPLIAKGKMTLSADFTYTHVFGETKTTQNTREASYIVVVPPLTTIMVSLMCTKGSSEVPYSYMQHDLLPNGEKVIVPKDDGIYRGKNSYGFYFESTKVARDPKGRRMFV